MSLSEIFGEVISEYTEEDAIRDGALHHIWPKQWPWLLVTNAVLTESEYKASERGVVLDNVLVPLVMDAIMETQRVAKANPRCDLVELEHTAVGTVWIRPNAKGGMTIMKPEDN
jgi:hypothetical protein